MLNEDGIPAENPYYDGMIDENPEIVYFDTLNDMVMALNSNQIDAIDLNRATADYLCANNDNLTILMDYSDDEAYETILTDFAFNSLLSFDFSLMMLESNQALADTISDALVEMEDDGTVDELQEVYIVQALEGEMPVAEMPVIDGADTIRVAVTGDLPPMDYVSPDGQPAGYNVAVLAEISRRIGVNIEPVPITAAARAMALASNQVDAVFWSRSCMTSRAVIEDGIALEDFFEPEDAEDEAMLATISDTIMPAFDYVTYNNKDIPEGLIVTERYYSDCIVLVARK